jgi:hypothetical protein
MAQKKEKKESRRTQVKELPQQEKVLSKEEQKKVKGGNWLLTPAGSAKPQTN